MPIEGLVCPACSKFVPMRHVATHALYSCAVNDKWRFAQHERVCNGRSRRRSPALKHRRGKYRSVSASSFESLQGSSDIGYRLRRKAKCLCHDSHHGSSSRNRNVLHRRQFLHDRASLWDESLTSTTASLRAPSPASLRDPGPYEHFAWESYSKLGACEPVYHHAYYPPTCLSSPRPPSPPPERKPLLSKCMSVEIVILRSKETAADKKWMPPQLFSPAAQLRKEYVKGTDPPTTTTTILDSPHRSSTTTAGRLTPPAEPLLTVAPGFPAPSPSTPSSCRSGGASRRRAALSPRPGQFKKPLEWSASLRSGSPSTRKKSWRRGGAIRKEAGDVSGTAANVAARMAEKHGALAQQPSPPDASQADEAAQPEDGQQGLLRVGQQELLPEITQPKQELPDQSRREETSQPIQAQQINYGLAGELGGVTLAAFPHSPLASGEWTTNLTRKRMSSHKSGNKLAPFARRLFKSIPPPPQKRYEILAFGPTCAIPACAIPVTGSTDLWRLTLQE